MSSKKKSGKSRSSGDSHPAAIVVVPDPCDMSDFTELFRTQANGLRTLGFALMVQPWPADLQELVFEAGHHLMFVAALLEDDPEMESEGVDEDNSGQGQPLPALTEEEAMVKDLEARIEQLGTLADEVIEAVRQRTGGFHVDIEKK